MERRGPAGARVSTNWRVEGTSSSPAGRGRSMPTRLPGAPGPPYLLARGAPSGPGASVDAISTVISHPLLGAITVGPVAAERTYALRQEVLRPHQRAEEMAAIDTGGPDGLVLGACTVEGEVVGTGRVAPEAPPALLAALEQVGPAWRIRGMATRADARGAGIGSAVLWALVAHAGAHGGGLVWCNARVAAQHLYERAGFATAGDVWTEPDIGPHVVMWRRVDAPTGP